MFSNKEKDRDKRVCGLLGGKPLIRGHGIGNLPSASRRFGRFPSFDDESEEDKTTKTPYKIVITEIPEKEMAIFVYRNVSKY